MKGPLTFDYKDGSRCKNDYTEMENIRGMLGDPVEGQNKNQWAT